MHVCGVQISEKEKWSVFIPREEQEHSLKSASSLLLLLSDVFLKCAGDAEGVTARPAVHISAGRQGLAVSKGSYLSTHHWLLTYLTQDCVTTAWICAACQQRNLKNTRLLFTGILVKRLKLQNKWHQKTEITAAVEGIKEYSANKAVYSML